MKKIIIVAGLLAVSVGVAIFLVRPKAELVITQDMVRFLDKGIGFVDQVNGNSLVVREKSGSVTYHIVAGTKVVNTFAKSIKTSKSGQAVVLSLNPSEHKVTAISPVDKIVKEMVDSQYVVFGTLVSSGDGKITITGLDGTEKTLILNQGVSLTSQTEYSVENIIQGQRVTVVSHTNESGESVADLISVNE